MSHLKIGNKNFTSKLIQGPLAGVSSAPFRRLVWRYSQPAFTCTEMISCKTLLYSTPAAQQRFIAKDPQEGALSFQLSANNPHELAEATKRVTDYGADLIDLNCGCPVTKIRAKDAGSKLLANPAELYKLIIAMKINTSVPVSIKIRVDGGSDEKYNTELAKVVTEAGADFLIVHGRHWTEHYETPCRFEQIKFFVEQLKIPVIGNGDVACFASLQRMLATGCAAVMIGRAGVGQPWLIAALEAQLRGEVYAAPSSFEIGSLFLEHIAALVAQVADEKFAIFQARNLGKYYARNLPARKEFSLALNSCESFTGLQKLCAEFFSAK